MRDELLHVMALQREFNSRNTPAMQRRGRLIRDVLPDELRRLADHLRGALGPYGEDLRFQGRDGTGLKTIIPWLRFYSHSRSRSAQNG